MQMQGQRSLLASQQQAWDALNDPAILKACVPGCDKFEPVLVDGAVDAAAPQYTVGTAIKIGPVSAKFAGKVALSDIQAPSSYRLSFDGSGGAAGFGKGQSAVTLTPQGSGCLLAYTVDAQVGGKIAQLGQRLIDGVAKSMADDFFKRFDLALAQRHPELALAAAAASAAENATNNVATNDGGYWTNGQFDLKNAVLLLLRDLQSPPWIYLAAAAAGGVVMLGLLLLARL